MFPLLVLLHWSQLKLTFTVLTDLNSAPETFPEVRIFSVGHVCLWMFSELVKLLVRKNKCFYFDRVFVSLLLLAAAIAAAAVYLKRCQFRPQV